MTLRPAAGGGGVEESGVGAGGSTVKDTEQAAGVFISETVTVAVLMIPMGGLCREPSGLLCIIVTTNIFIGEDIS